LYGAREKPIKQVGNVERDRQNIRQQPKFDLFLTSIVGPSHPWLQPNCDENKEALNEKADQNPKAKPVPDFGSVQKVKTTVDKHKGENIKPKAIHVGPELFEIHQDREIKPVIEYPR